MSTSHSFVFALAAAVAAACTPSPRVDGPGSLPDDTATPTGPTSPVVDTALGSATGDTGPALPTFDCDTIPLTPVSVREVPGARGYHDLAFDDQGYVVGSTTFGDLLRADYVGNTQVFVPNLGTLQQFTWLPDGDLAVASDSRGILRVSPSGGYTPINGGIYAYGLILGPDGMLYAADQRVVHRVDPNTGDARVIVPEGVLDRGTPRVIAFDRTYEHLLIGTLGGNQGRLYAVPLDEALDPTGPPFVFATGVGSGQYHDAIGVDLCGYLYVPDYTTSALFRVHPTTGQVQRLHESGPLGGEYGHGVAWGSGVGGWLDHAIYLPRPYASNKVNEIDIGVPELGWPGAVAINLP